MPVLAQLRVLLTLDATTYARDVRRAQRVTRRFGRDMERMGRKMTLWLTTPILGAGVASIKAASDLAEAVNKVRVTFGDAAGIIERFGETSARSFGMSKRAAYDAAGTFGNLFTTMGIGKRQAAEMSVRLLKLASDLASYHNLRVDEVLEKIRSGLVGEIRPMRQLGVLLEMNRAKAKAFEMGLADANGQISQSALVLARYQLILEQTKNAQGDFWNTADLAANSMRILSAEWENARAELGEHLIPLFISATHAAIDFLEVVEKMPEPMQRLALVAAGMTAAAGPTLTVTGKLTRTFADLAGKAAAAGGWMALLSKGAAGLKAAALSGVGATMALGGAVAIMAGLVREIDKGFKGLKEVYEKHRREVVMTSETYEDYLFEVRRAAEAAGRTSISHEVLAEALERDREAAMGLAHGLGALTRSEWEHVRLLARAADEHEAVRLAAMHHVDVLDAARMRYEEMREALLGSLEAEKGFQNRLELLRQTIQGPLASAYERWRGDMAGIRQQMDETQRKIAELESRTYLTPDQREQLVELYTRMDDLRAKLDETTEAYRRQRAELAYTIAEKFLLRAVEQGLVQDLNNSGTALDEVYTALTTLAEGLGLVDQKTANYQQRILEVTQAWIDGKISAEQYAAMVRSLSSALDSIPREIETRISIDVEGGLPRWATRGDVKPIPNARGGDYIVRGPTLFLAGEAGPERATFTPLGRGGVVEPAASRGVQVVVNIQYAPAVSLGDEMEAERVLGPLVAEQVRRAMAGAAI